jgi:hypothetical protein
VNFGISTLTLRGTYQNYSVNEGNLRNSHQKVFPSNDSSFRPSLNFRYSLEVTTVHCQRQTPNDNIAVSFIHQNGFLNYEHFNDQGKERREP